MEAGSTSLTDNPSTSISESSTLIQLPEELITQILLRLPVKSLLKFKCVSKPWLHLISNPLFITSHFSKSSSVHDEGENLNLQFLFVTRTGMKRCSLYSAFHKPHPFFNVSAIEFLDRKTHPIVGIINGLVCLNLKGTDLCLWNPALNNKIKPFNGRLPSVRRFGAEYFFSFGYDASSDDYKVVCLESVTVYRRVEAEVHIYSLKDETWRRIDELKGFHLSNPGVFANGKMYWSGDLWAPPPKCNILSLDMSSEKFVELQHPDYDAGNGLLSMGESGGRLFVLCAYYKGQKEDIWVLDKRGVEESWCKLVSIPYNDVLPNLSDRVLYIVSRGEIVFGNKYGLRVYNWKKKESRSVTLDIGITTHWKMGAYVESLVWPNNA